MSVTKSLSAGAAHCTLEDLVTAFGLRPIDPAGSLQHGRSPVADVHWMGDTFPLGEHPWVGVVPPDPISAPATLDGCVGLIIGPASEHSRPEWVTDAIDLLVAPAGIDLRRFAEDLQAAVEHRTLSMLTRALGVQRDVLDALTSPRVEFEIVHRLHQRLNVDAAIVAASGAIMAMSPNFPQVIAEHTPTIRSEGAPEQEHDGFHIMLSAFDVGESQVDLILAWSEDRAIHRTELHAATRVVEVVLQAHERAILLARQEDFAHRAQILTELLNGVGPTRLELIIAELTMLDIALDAPFTLHILRGRSTQAQPMDALLQRMRGRLSQERSLMLVGQRDEDIVVIYASNARITDALIQDERSAWHGVSAEFTDLQAAPDALRQARISLATGQRTGTFMAFSELDFLDFVLGQIPADVFQEKTSSMLKLLSGGAMLLETIVEFFRHSMDIQATAQAMHLHPNTIRYRLNRIEVTLGMSLSDPQTVTVLYLVLRDRIVDGPTSLLDSIAAM